MEEIEHDGELRPQPPPRGPDDTPAQPWRYDIVTEHASLTTTGGRIWDAARRLASYLEAMSGPLGLQRPGLRVLELGAGLGWLGMTLARNIAVDPGQGGMVVLTEQEAGGGLDWLAHNLRLNAAALRRRPADDGSGGGQGQQAQQGQQGAAQGEAGQGQQAQGEGERQQQEQQQQQQQPEAVRAEACDWFLYCHPDRAVGAGAGAGVGRDQGGGGGGATADGEASGQAGTGPGAGAAASSRCHAEPLAPGASLAAAGLAAARPADAGGGGEGCGGSRCPDSAGPDGAGGDGGSGGGGGWLSGVCWDLIIGSDLVYNEVGAVYLPRVLRALSRPGHTRILYAHTKHRFDTWDMRFYEELAAQGLSCAEVHEPGVPSPPPSPPPLTELFPDMRVAVFQIGEPPS
ncbi:hypothetical protein HXX76_009738 [Chlamydomonas incerta]|uniref:Uncharacterized protein n=1 Tax=Chlamydomonas incerta TaxID=51695 RepID=A0A835T3L5_CHLIN|nr:hypothetical protein HXX76_009738 [Chlamydomonas incerta]|eukprot:KAG2431210.1 hypothetical protein HXX76_009738 [Chlamydomonas incerta]